MCQACWIDNKLSCSMKSSPYVARWKHGLLPKDNWFLNGSINTNNTIYKQHVLLRVASSTLRFTRLLFPCYFPCIQISMLLLACKGNINLLPKDKQVLNSSINTNNKIYKQRVCFILS